MISILLVVSCKAETQMIDGIAQGVANRVWEEKTMHSLVLIKERKGFFDKTS